MTSLSRVNGHVISATESKNATRGVARNIRWHPSLRNVATAVFLMVLALPGCPNRLGPVRATQSGGSTGHANLPDIMVEHAKNCMELHGSQLEPGRVILESTVEVNEEGAKVGVTIADIPATAPDLGACMRNALRDMPIAEQPFREALETLKFHRKHANDSEGALRGFIEVIPGVPIVESQLVLEVDGYTVVLPVTVKVRAELETLIDGDKRTLAKLGQLAIDTLGYDEIMRRAKQVGWVKTVRKIQPKASAGKRLIAQSETEVVVVMFEVFTEYAVTAGVVSQVDSPLPGPADLAAIGILAVGLYKVGAVAIDALSTATAPAPTPQPPPPPPPPLPQPPQTQPDCPRNESFVPARTDNSSGCTDNKGNIRCYSSRHYPCAGVHTHGKLRYQKIRSGVCVEVEDKAVRCEGPFTVAGPCGSVSTVECRDGGPEISGIFVQK